MNAYNTLITAYLALATAAVFLLFLPLAGINLFGMPA